MSSLDTDEENCDKKLDYSEIENYSSKAFNTDNETKTQPDVDKKISAKTEIKNDGSQEKERRASSDHVTVEATETEVNENSPVETSAARSTIQQSPRPDYPLCSTVKTERWSNPTRSWRDPDFVYERNAPIKNSRSTERYSSRNRIKDDADVETKGSSREHFTISDKRERMRENGGRCKERNWRLRQSVNDAKMSNRETLGGWWSLYCDTELVVSNGQTEMEIVWNSIKELYEERPDLVAKPPKRFDPGYSGMEIVLCHTYDYTDKLHIAKVASAIRNKISCLNFPFPIYYYSKAKSGNLYMHTCDGDLYETLDKYLKIVNFSQ